MGTLTNFTAVPAGGSESKTPAPVKAETLITVSMADLQVCDQAHATLTAYALGSCIGVAVWDRELKIAGLMHVMLPSSRAGAGTAWVRPAMFADTAVPLILGRLLQLGCRPENLVVKLAGGGQLLAESRQMAIGTRNIAAVRAAFALQGITIAAEDVGGTKSRSLKLEVGSGNAWVCSRGEESAL
jgi:chemotaxis protein CheD